MCMFRNWDFLIGGWLDRPGYFKGVESFSDGVRVFWEIEHFSSGGIWGFFIMVDAILVWLKLLRGVMLFRFLVDWDFFFNDGGGRLIFFQKHKVSHGIKIFLVTWVFCQDVRDFSGSGWGLTFFLEVIQFFLGGGYILKLAFSHDEVLSCILQNALNCSLK